MMAVRMTARRPRLRDLVDTVKMVRRVFAMEGALCRR